MRNLTISVDEELARWARVAAAENDMSVSRFIAELLRAKMEDDESYERAMARSTARQAVALKPTGGSYPAREELHE